MLVGQEISEITDALKEREKREIDKSEVTWLLRQLAPIVLTQLILNDKIDKTKIGDKGYLFSKLKNYKDDIASCDVFYVTEFHEDFIKAAKEAIEANRLEVAVVLISTVIEHILNINYRIAMRFQKVSDDDITKIIRRSNFEDKTGWLMKFVLKKELEEDLKKRILKIIEIRNRAVHFKAIPETFADEIEKDITIRDDIKKLDFDMFEIPEELDEFMNAQIISMFPDLKLVNEMVDVMLSEDIYVSFGDGSKDRTIPPSE